MLSARLAAFLIIPSSLASVIRIFAHDSIDISRNPTTDLRQVFARADTASPAPHLSGTLNAQGPAGIEWDQSCSDGKQRAAIHDAWSEALDLVTAARDGLQELAAGLPNTPEPSNTPDPTNARYIAGKDPAYTQLYGALSGRIRDVQQIYQNAIDNMENENGPKRNGVKLRLICDPNFMNQAGTKNECNDGTDAFTFIIENSKDAPDVEAKYAIPNTAMINFCPSFFTSKPSQQDVLIRAEAASAAGRVVTECNLDHLTTQALVMLHEWSHLRWVATTLVDPDPYGYRQVALAVRNGKKVQWGFIKQLADTVAWYAQYHYWNSLSFCKGVTNGGTCVDVWPTSTEKPNPVVF